MNIHENEIVSVVKPYILKCRSGDWEHAKRVVGWVKDLGKNRKDLALLIATAYVHDIGWYKLVNSNEKLSREVLLKIQPKADKQTHALVNETLGKLPFTSNEIATILRLINATETYKAKEEDEMILVDADNLSKTSPDHVKEKYTKSDWLNICDLFEENLPQRIKTEKGKNIFSAKLKELRESLKKELNS